MHSVLQWQRVEHFTDRGQTYSINLQSFAEYVRCFFSISWCIFKTARVKHSDKCSDIILEDDRFHYISLVPLRGNKYTCIMCKAYTNQIGLPFGLLLTSQVNSISFNLTIRSSDNISMWMSFAVRAPIPQADIQFITLRHHPLPRFSFVEH